MNLNPRFMLGLRHIEPQVTDVQNHKSWILESNFQPHTVQELWQAGMHSDSWTVTSVMDQSVSYTDHNTFWTVVV